MKRNSNGFFERLLLRASTIDERLSDQFEVVLGTSHDASQAKQRLNAWCTSAANGDWSLFSQRLARDHLSIETVLLRLGHVRYNPSHSLPDWYVDSLWLFDELTSESTTADLHSQRAEQDKQPFEEVLVSAVVAADRFVSSSIQQYRAHMDSARRSLRAALLHQLSILCAPALYDKMKRWSDDATTMTAKGEETPTYASYVNFMKSSGWALLLDEKPILLRLIAVLCRQWIGTTVEFIERYQADESDIRAHFSNTIGTAALVSLQCNVSDFHNFGRAAHILQFSNGSHLLYKPKSLEIDVELSYLVRQLNFSDSPIDLKLPKTIARSVYGWTEFVGCIDCQSPGDAVEYFRRAGAWMAIFHILCATDMHEENIIANGKYPVPVDLEMLFQAAKFPDRVMEPYKQAIEAAGDKLAESVIMTGLLPEYIRVDQNLIIQNGGLNIPAAKTLRVIWEHLGSLKMKPIRSSSDDVLQNNIPRLNGDALLLGDYVSEVQDGFRDYSVFLADEQRTQDFISFIDRMSSSSVRIVRRPTLFYGLLIERLSDFRKMNDGMIWSAQLDFVARLADWEELEDPAWQLVSSERASLKDFNIPYFTSPVDGKEINDASSKLAELDVIPGRQHSLDRLARNKPSEIAWQMEVINLASSTAPRSNPARPAVWLNHSIAIRSDEHSDVEFVEVVCHDVFRRLSSASYQRGPGAAWIGLDWLGDSDFCHLVPAGPDLYNGAPGIGVFLAAYGKHFDSSEARHLALASVASLRGNIRGPNAARFARGVGIGAATGVGSIIYSLCVLSEMLGNRDLIDDAFSVCRLLTDDLVAADQQLDVFGGTAGAILGLMKLYSLTEEPEVLARAEHCATHLLKTARQGSPGARSWSGLEGTEPWAGFSHGAAGIAYSLMRLSTLAQNNDLESAANECLAYEALLFSESHGNWPTGKNSTAIVEGDDWNCQWCHGAGGIGLSRIGISRAKKGSDKSNTEIDSCVRAVLKAWPYPVDTLCCGNLGNVEFLREAAAELNRPDLSNISTARLVGVLRAAATRGDYLWTNGNGKFNVGLFRGIAGVGYVSLRELSRNYPNILLWE